MANDKTLPPTEAPETAATYERTKQKTTVKPAEAQTETSEAARSKPLPAGGVLKGDMKTEEPTGWDLAPQAIQEAERKRHPRPDGVGGSDAKSATQSERRPSELDK